VTRVLRGAGRRLRVCKPVATGAYGEPFSDDTVKLAEAASAPRDEWRRITPWTFPDPVAPPVAARRQGTTLKLSEMVEAVHAQAEPGALMLVEGAGGLLCPLTETETVADLAAELGMPLVVVCRRSLGTLNHTLLTLDAARQRKLTCAGLVVNETSPPRSLAEETNVEELLRRVTVPLLAVVPYQERPSSEVPGPLAAVDWWKLSQNQPMPAFEQGSAKP
jgi:dethiobiotin synthetase